MYNKLKVKISRKRNDSYKMRNLKNVSWCHFIVYFLFISVVCYNTYSVFQIRCDNSEVIVKLQKDYKQATSQLRILRQKHHRLIARIKRHAGRFPTSFLNNTTSEWLPPALDYEDLHRSMRFNTKEFWYCFSGQLKRIDNRTTKPVRRQIKKDLLEMLAERKRWLLVQQEQLAACDGYSEWRRQEASDVSTIVQRRLWFLQNPPNCRAAKKLVCTHNQGGFGCKHHHLMFCLMFAYATKRTLILSEKKWSYNARFKGWKSVFYELSDTCNEALTETTVLWNGGATNDAKVVLMPPLNIEKALKMKPLLLPYFIPNDLAKRISRFSSDPTAWWAGQMMKYILRPRPGLYNAVYASIENMNFTGYNLAPSADKPPMVGVHIRWTDKDREAPLYKIKSYMTHVEDYYLKLEMTRKVHERRVYVATDDDNVLKQIVAQYPGYVFYGSETRAQTASTDTSRYTERGLIDLLADLNMLTMCDYVVTTFSSNYGKMVYELMHTITEGAIVDATHRFHSLDDVYFMCSSTLEPHYRKAVIRNTKHPRFEIGDIIKHYYFRPGSVGKIMRTQDHGPVPWYKTVEQLTTYMSPRHERMQVYIEDAPNDTVTEDHDFAFNFDIARKLIAP